VLEFIGVVYQMVDKRDDNGTPSIILCSEVRNLIDKHCFLPFVKKVESFELDINDKLTFVCCVETLTGRENVDLSDYR
jgi:hypothetical protein